MVSSSKVELCNLCGFITVKDQCINSRCPMFGVGKYTRSYAFQQKGGSFAGTVMPGRGFDPRMMARGKRLLNEKANNNQNQKDEQVQNDKVSPGNTKDTDRLKDINNSKLNYWRRVKRVSVV
jgi:hypothetical protein